MYFVCARASLLISVYLTFVPLGSRWAGIYPAATNAAGRKDETGDRAVEMARTWQSAIWRTLCVI